MQDSKILKLLHVFLVVGTLSAQIPQYKWGIALGTTVSLTVPIPIESSQGTDILTDNQGNVYTVGSFFGTLDFDPGPSLMNRTSNGSGDAFVVKTDSMGNFIWVKTFGGNGNEQCTSIAQDNAGNIYVGGSFSLTVDFDPGPASHLETSQGNLDGYVVKLDASGNFVYVRCLNGTGIDLIKNLTIDPIGNIGIVGCYGGITDFDPGLSINSYTCLGGLDAFVVKLNVLGDFMWARSYGAWSTTYGDEEANDLVFDQMGNLFITGSFMYSVDFDEGPGFSNQVCGCSIAVFLLQLDASGNYVWSKSFGGLSGAVGVSIQMDASGNIFVAGSMGYDTQTGDFDPGTGIFNLTGNGQLDIFLVKLTSSGNFLWARNFGGATYDEPGGIAIDRNGNIIIVGFFSGTVDFDPSSNTNLITPNGNRDAFISILSNSGNFVWAGKLGGPSSNEFAASIFTKANGTTYIAGFGGNNFDCDPGTGTASLSGYMNEAAFVVKLKETCIPPTAPLDITPIKNKTLCKNNSVATLSVSSSNPVLWYASPTSTTSIATGTVITTPSLTVGTYTYYASASGCTTSARTAIKLTVNECLSIANIEESEQMCSVFPNPISNIGTIKTPELLNRASLKVMDVTGKIVIVPYNYSAPFIQINTESLGNGIYFFEVFNEKKYYSGKFIVTK